MSLPTPNTRKEQYLNAIATGNAGGLPTPITREEEYLEAIAKSGGGSGEGDMKKSVYDSDLAVANAGGIKAFVGGAVDEVESKSWSLGGGTSITNNTDLNDITTVGNYYATTQAAATLSHVPTAGGFKLKVLYDVRETAPTYIEQVFNPISSYDEYRRYKSGSAEWSDWHLTNCNLDEEKGKVADNTSAIEAIANEYGAKNLLDCPDKTLSASGYVTRDTPLKLSAGNYELTFDFSGASDSSQIVIQDSNHSDLFSLVFNVISGTNKVSITLSTESAYITYFSNAVGDYSKFMIRDARITDPTYVPYAMTNKELTADVKWLKNKTFVNIPSGGSFSYNINECGYFVAINRQDDAGAIYYTSGNTVTRIAGSNNIVDQMISISYNVVTIVNDVSWAIHATIF